MSRYRLRTLGLALVLAGLAACDGQASGGTDTTVSLPPTTTTTAAAPATTAPPAPASVPIFEGQDFYTPPDPLPAGLPGDVVWAEPLSAPSGAVAWRVLYRSQALDGRDIAVSGYVMAPDGPAPDGGRPVVAWAHGTTGLADVCAPSNSASLPIEMGFWKTLFVDRGYVVAATDYEGLGTPGTHPYIVGDSEGRSVLDIVRAAGRITEAGASERFVVWGHSQGGHASLFAGELAPTWAPELVLEGVVAGAPPSGFADLSEALDASAFRGYMVMVATGFQAAYPEVDVTGLFSEQTLEALDILETGCVQDIIPALRGIPELFETDRFDEEPWGSLLAANDPGNRSTPAPILILHGGDDEQIPVDTSADLLERLCALGNTASRTVYPGQDHTGAVFAYADDMIGWIEDRLAGRPAPSDCG